MRVHQPGSHLMEQRGARVADWSWSLTRRRMATLWSLAAAYRGRTALSIVSLLLATLTALAPPFLAKYALDDATKGHTGTRLFLIVGAFLAGGTEKLRGGEEYGVPLVDGFDGAEIVVDLSDEPVLGPRERLRLASHVLAAGIPYCEAHRDSVSVRVGEDRKVTVLWCSLQMMRRYLRANLQRAAARVRA